jgi:hypothetical protein
MDKESLLLAASLMNEIIQTLRSFRFKHFFPHAPLLGSSIPYWGTGLITQCLDLLQAVGFLGRVISSSQGLYLNTEKRGHTLNIHAKGGIRTRNHGL